MSQKSNPNSAADRRATTVGWVFVACQAALLLLLILTPGPKRSVPLIVRYVAQVLFVGGLSVVVIAAFGLGRSLTPTPVPKKEGQLSTDGLFTFVRHPIYSGVMLAVIGMVLRSPSPAKIAVGLLLIVFFNVKARWEEQRLRNAYPGYSVYCERTPRFIPSLGRRS
jgi:protein-S-isoprenylcysteine O-methyltransferase Ste14